MPGPTAFLPELKDEADLALVAELVAAYSKYDRLDGNIVVAIAGGEGRASGEERREMPRPYDRTKFKEYQIC